MIILLILLPLAAGVLLCLTRRAYALNMVIAIAASAAHLVLAVFVSRGSDALYSFAPYGFALCFRVGGIGAFFLLLSAAMSVLLAVYTAGYFRERAHGGFYQLCLFISMAMIDGALLSDSITLMLFFWEGLLCTLFAILLLGNREKPATAIKALTVSGIADLLLMLGIAITVHCSGTVRMSEMHGIPITGLGAAGFGCLMAGALGKAGCMPFHSWIPDAAADAPTPFLAAFPGTFEKIVGIYLASRITTGIYAYEPGSLPCLIVMAFAALTLIGGVAMALIQKDMKRLLAYHAISQVGYIILGVGSGLDLGVAAGVFHLLNHVMYKSGLFMAAGAVELCAGTTDLHRLGGLRRKMPVTAICVIIFALSISGFPGTNGFASKELIFDAALEISPAFYAFALIGAFMTAVSFLKLTRSVFFGTLRSQRAKPREARISMTAPMLALAAACLLCAAVPSLPLDGFIGRAYGYTASFASLPKSALMVAASCCALLLALADHLFGCKKTGSALSAADHLHDLPLVKQLYALASKGAFDPYNWLMKLMGRFSSLCVFIERGVSWLYDKGIPLAVDFVGDALSYNNNGSLSRYLLRAVLGLAAVALIFFVS